MNAERTFNTGTKLGMGYKSYRKENTVTVVLTGKSPAGDWKWLEVKAEAKCNIEEGDEFSYRFGERLALDRAYSQYCGICKSILLKQVDGFESLLNQQRERVKRVRENSQQN